MYKYPQLPSQITLLNPTRCVQFLLFPPQSRLGTSCLAISVPFFEGLFRSIPDSRTNEKLLPAGSIVNWEGQSPLLVNNYLVIINNIFTSSETYQPTSTTSSTTFIRLIPQPASISLQSAIMVSVITFLILVITMLSLATPVPQVPRVGYHTNKFVNLRCRGVCS